MNKHHPANNVTPKGDYLKNKNVKDITFAQKKATENVFRKRNIPFRSFEIKKRYERWEGCFRKFYDP